MPFCAGCMQFITPAAAKNHKHGALIIKKPKSKPKPKK